MKCGQIRVSFSKNFIPQKKLRIRFYIIRTKFHCCSLVVEGAQVLSRKQEPMNGICGAYYLTEYA